MLFEDIVVTGVEYTKGDLLTCALDAHKQELDESYLYAEHPTILHDPNVLSAVEGALSARWATFVWRLAVAQPFDCGPSIVLLEWLDAFRGIWLTKEFEMSMRADETGTLKVHLRRPPALSISFAASPHAACSTLTPIVVCDGSLHFSDVCVVAVDRMHDASLLIRVGIIT